MIDYREIFDQTSSPYLLLMPDMPTFTIVDVNRSYLNATMTSKEKIIGKSLFEVFPDNPDEHGATGVNNLRRSLNRVAQDKVVDIMAVQKYDIHRPDGSFEERWWNPINTPIISEEGILNWIIHHVVDVTNYIKRQQRKGEKFSHSQADVKRIESEIITSGQKLQEANQQLRKARETISSLYQNCEKVRIELERSNKNLDQFTRFVSHDLQEPLRTIKAYLVNITKDLSSQLKSDTLENINEAIAGADRMQILIHDLLTFSRFSYGTQTFTLVSIKDIIDIAIHNLKDSISQSKADISVESMPNIHADKTQMILLFQNLISNAVKYRRGIPKIRINCKFENSEWIFSIHDTGIGIEEKHFDTIFMMFQRLFTREEYPGTGIGLALCKRIVENHDGKIWVNSKVNEGTTFYFSIPASQKNTITGAHNG